ncbi:hypothetical protein X975_25286, partial [Stegodyphus mimosarum]
MSGSPFAGIEIGSRTQHVAGEVLSFIRHTPGINCIDRIRQVQPVP